MAVMGKVAKFCRARQAFCHHATQVPQVALLLSTPGNYLRSKGPFSRDPVPYRNTLFQLLGEHYSVELLSEHRLTAKRLFPDPIVELTGSSDVDVTVNRIGGKLAINLVNASGPHAVQPLIESIAPVGPLQVKIRQPSKPSNVALHPAGTSLPFQYKDGKVELIVPEVKIHDILVVE